MIPVDQTKFGNPEGNCFNACLASILEIPLESIPDIMRDAWNDSWFTDYCKWMEQFNLTLAMLTFGSWLPPGYSILSGEAERGLEHSVVAFSGKMVHDPHPSHVGLIEGKERDWIIFAVLNPSKVVNHA